MTIWPRVRLRPSTLLQKVWKGITVGFTLHVYHIVVTSLIAAAPSPTVTRNVAANLGTQVCAVVLLDAAIRLVPAANGNGCAAISSISRVCVDASIGARCLQLTGWTHWVLALAIGVLGTTAPDEREKKGDSACKRLHG